MSNETQTSNENKSHGCLIAFIIIIVVIAAVGFGIYKLIETNSSNTTGSTNGNTDGNTKLFSRSANNNDITMETDVDWSSFGTKVKIRPQTDIKDLDVMVILTDKNKETLYTTTKALGNVKEGVEVSFSLSITEIGLSATLKCEYVTVRVVGGTVSYFA